MRSTAWFVAFFTTAAASSSFAQALAKPNLIVIVADDLGYADVGFQGCKEIPTPHLDRLAKTGVRCTSGYVTHSFCAPSRAALLSGRYQQRFGFENNPEFLPHDDQVGLPVDQVLLPAVLQSAGYKTGMVGKWHLGASPPFHPLNRGFEHLFGFLGGGHQYFPKEWTVAEPRETRDEYRTKLLRNRTPVEESEYLTDAFSREAAAFIERCGEQPFFLYLAYNAPHTPLQATEKYLRRVRHIKNRERRIYGAMICAVDDGVGRVLDTLARRKLDRRTLIFFLSDNGGQVREPAARNTPLRAGKGTVYEGGVRVPFVVRWTGQLPAGGDYDAPVSALDIYATAAAAANAEVPASHVLDGVDLLPYLKGERQSPPHDALYWRMGGGSSFAVRRGAIKLTEPKRGEAELFDLATDIGETTDLAAERPALLEELESLKRAWNSELIPPRWQNPHANAKRRPVR